MAANHDMIPLHELGPKDEAVPGTIASAEPTQFLPDLKNFATDDDTVKLIRDELLPVLQQTRMERKPLEDEWSAIRRMEHLVHDDGQRYKGRSNAYLPLYNRALGTLVAQLSRGLFPSDEYMDVGDRGGSTDNAKATKQYIQWEFERVAQLRRHIKPLLRQHQNWGTTVLKHGYRKEVRPRGHKEKLDGSIIPKFSMKSVYEGLHVTTRNLMNWYLFPATVDSLAEAQGVFEDISIPVTFIEEMKVKGVWHEAEKAIEYFTPEQLESAQAEQISDSANGMSINELAKRKYGAVRTVTEIWTFLKLPASAYLPDEDKRLPIPVRIVMSGDHVLACTRNPFFHQRPPYEASSQNRSAGLFYGYGAGKTVRYLQYLANDFANQTNDAGTYALNPIVKANPGTLVGPMTPIKPGGVWWTTDPQGGIIMDRPPTDLIPSGLQMVAHLSALTQDGSGAPPVLQGTGAKGAAKTATGAQILQRNAMMPLQDVVEDLELDIMIQLMYITWVNAQQYRDEEVMALIAGKEPMKVSPEMLMIDPDFIWMASSQAANQQMRAQQAMQLLQAVAPVLPVLMQQGYIVDFAPLIQKVYTDGFGFRGFEQFIRKADPAAMGAPGMTPGMVPPGVAAQQEEGVRSTLEQIAGMGDVEMVPGEGDDFAAVRAMADQIAGEAGGAM